MMETGYGWLTRIDNKYISTDNNNKWVERGKKYYSFKEMF